MRCPYALVAFIILSISLCPVKATSCIKGNDWEATAKRTFWLEAYSYQTFSIQCIVGDTVTVSFKVLEDGGLFPGDDTKYDEWVGWGSGLEFYVFNEENYTLWANDSNNVPILVKTGLIEYTYSIEVNDAVTFYFVLQNDSIYRKHTEWIMNRNSPSEVILFFGVLILCISSILAVVIYLIKYHSIKR